MQKFMLGAYWNARPDSMEQCTDFVAKFFQEFVNFDPVFSRWYGLGRSRKEALSKEVDVLDRSALERSVLKGRNKRDTDRTVIDELGSHIDFWNGKIVDEMSYTISIQCGSYNSRILNGIKIDIPEKSILVSDKNLSIDLMKLVVNIWRPAWGGIMSKDAMEARNFSAEKPFVDWITYVPYFVDGVSEPGYVEYIDGVESIIVTQHLPPTGREEEMARICNIQKILTNKK